MAPARLNAWIQHGMCAMFVSGTARHKFCTATLGAAQHGTNTARQDKARRRHATRHGTARHEDGTAREWHGVALRMSKETKKARVKCNM